MNYTYPCEVKIKFLFYPILDTTTALMWLRSFKYLDLYFNQIPNDTGKIGTYFSTVECQFNSFPSNFGGVVEL